MSKTLFSTQVDLQIASKLRSDLEEQGFEITTPPYTLFSGRKKGISCTLYESGRLVVQGKEISPFIEFYLEPEVLGRFSFSHPLAEVDRERRIGMDEAGKGDFFGPLCIATLCAGGEEIDQLHALGVKDSKSLSDGSIGKIAKALRAQFPHTIIRLFPEKYNELYQKFQNLNHLMSWVHVAALSELSQKTGCKKAILDQFAHPALVERRLKQKKLSIDLTQRTRGEEDLVVAAASILARDAFVEGIETLEKRFEMKLPKGASSPVIQAAKQFVAQFGKEMLPKVAKTHFKTMAQL